MRIAVLGTGTMGLGMARSLLRGGHEVVAWNRHAERAQPLEADGARVVTDVADAVREAEVVLTMLFDEAAVAEAAELFLRSMADDAIWMQCATVGPDGARRLAQRASAAGIALVDAPVVGTKQPAAEGALVVLASGDAAALERLAPAFDAIGSKTVTAGGEIGAASALKLACNAWIAAVTAGVAQSVALCGALGVDPRLFLSAIDGGPTSSPYAQLKGGMMVDGDFTPSFGVDGLVKDLGLMVDAVGEPSASIRLVDVLRDHFAVAGAAGHGADDIAAVVTAYRG